MHDIFLANPNINILERIFDEKKKPCLAGDCKLLLKKMQRGDSINVGYKISLQRVRPQKS